VRFCHRENSVRKKPFVSFRTMCTSLMLFLSALTCADRSTTLTLESNAYGRSEQESGKSRPSDLAELSSQIQQLQKQMAELKASSGSAAGPRIVAAGTATFKLGAEQDNATYVRVRLDSEVVGHLGTDYIVLLTTRFPAGGYPFFVPYWKRAGDGFDVTLVDVTLGPGATASYATQQKTYLIDWVVVKARP
jgi:hypothetical protein